MYGHVLAIDPGSVYSGWCLMGDDYRPLAKGKDDNVLLYKRLRDGVMACRTAVIEMVASYGMPVGREVFETCVVIGHYEEILDKLGIAHDRVYRQEEKIAICHSPQANDATIRRALADRFAYGAKNYGKGTKKNPGFFYGFSQDAWSAYAVGVTYLDRQRRTSK